MRTGGWRDQLNRKIPLPWPSKKGGPRLEQSEYRSYRAVHPFDERFDVETSGLAYDLPTGHESDAYNNGYFGVAPSIFLSIFEQLDLDYRDFTFVDAGSGKGRALLLAAGYPFREIVGIELSPALDRIARSNIARYLSRHGCGNGAPVSSVQGDVAEYRWPSGPLLVYMWNSFTAPVMERVLNNLQAALLKEAREIYLVYVHPELEQMLDSLPWLERLWFAEIEMSEEDYSAWAFPVRSEVCAVYRAIARA